MPRAPRTAERDETVRAIVDDELRRAHVLTNDLATAYGNLTEALHRARRSGCTWDELARVTRINRSTLRHWLEKPRQLRPSTLSELVPQPRHATPATVAS